ncbi:hypothetical protein GGI24_000485 [Coemansia furcata]|nr:hypothetical protein GGI24_000485 [Coemansia furcata]
MEITRDLPNPKKELQRMKGWEKRLMNQRGLLQTPREEQQWQEQWDEMTAGKKAAQQRLSESKETRERKRLERIELLREAKLKEEQRVREMLEARDRARQSRRQAVLERERHARELALTRSIMPTVAPSPNRALQWAFAYLTPVPGLGCSPNDLLAHLRCLQRVAAVSREWRAAALPLLYRTAYIITGDPIDALDADDSDDDMWPLNTAGRSQNNDNIRLRTNIGLFDTGGLVDNVREVHIIVQGSAQAAGQILRQLQLARLGVHAWPSVERLRMSVQDCGSKFQTNVLAENDASALKELNDFLSRTLPSLREIEFHGPHSKAVYGCVPIERLIRERLHRPEALRVIRVKSDCWPQLTDDYDTGVTALPIAIECMEISGPDHTCLAPIPIMMAETLVELKLSPMADEVRWKLFEGLSDLDSTANGSDLSKPPLAFSSLKSLVVDYTSLFGRLKHRPGAIVPTESEEDSEERNYHRWRRDNPGKSYFSYTNESEEEDSDSLLMPSYLAVGRKNKVRNLCFEDVKEKMDKRFDVLPTYDTPTFPVLTSLDFRHKVTLTDLKMFAASPISLQHLTIAIDLGEYSQLNFSKPLFADSLVSLTLEGELRQYEVEYILPMFPNLRTFSVCAIFSEPIFSVPELVTAYRCMSAKRTFTSLNSSLRVLEVYGKRYFTGYDGWNCIPRPQRIMAPELDHHRGMLVSFVCRLPALDMLRVSAKSVDGVNESIGAIVDTEVGQKRIRQLKHIRVRPLDY